MTLLVAASENSLTVGLFGFYIYLYSWVRAVVGYNNDTAQKIYLIQVSKSFKKSWEMGRLDRFTQM